MGYNATQTNVTQFLATLEYILTEQGYQCGPGAGLKVANVVDRDEVTV